MVDPHSEIRSIEDQLTKRWELILGNIPKSNSKLEDKFSGEERRISEALDWVYEDEEIKGKTNKNYLQIGNWLKEVNSLFNFHTTSIIQQDAIKKYGLEVLLQEDILIDQISPDIHMALAILQFKSSLPDKAKEKARQIIRSVAAQLTEKIKPEVQLHMSGRLYSKLPETYSRKPRINWHRTIKANLDQYQLDYKTILPQKWVSQKRSRKQINTICILVDQSFSMGESVCHASIFASIFHQLPALKTHLITFSTDVVDLTAQLDDPVDVLFSVQLGGSTNISKAITYAYQQVDHPEQTLLILISDLEETDEEHQLERIIPALPEMFKRSLVILALNEEGKGSWDEYFLQLFVDTGIPCVASTPLEFTRLVSELL